MKRILACFLTVVTLLGILIPISSPVAAEEGTGSISGIVYESDGSTIIAGATVSAYSVTGPIRLWEPVACNTTNSSGSYQIAGLSPGNYRVAAVAAGYERNFYPSSNIIMVGDNVTVSGGADTSGIDFSLDPGGTISGCITVNGGPAEGVSVAASVPGVVGAYSMAVTATDGSYTLDGLPFTNNYIVMAPTQGNLGSRDNSHYIREYWQEKYIGAEATLLLAGSTDIDFTLETGGIISGQITVTTGSGLVMVNVFDYDSLSGSWIGMGGVPVIVTDSTTNYATNGLPDGKYAIRTMSISGTIYAQEWWQDTYYRSGAIPVEISGGTDQENKDFTLELGGSISGHIRAEDQDNVYNCHVYAAVYTTNMWINGVNTDANGNYTLSGLPAGSYRVRAVPSNRGLPYVDEWYDNTYRFDEAREVVVTADQTTAGINFTLDPGGTISGSVTDENDNPIGNCHVNASIYNTDEWVAGINTNIEGYYTLVVPAGDYKVGAHPSNTGLNYVGKFYNNRYGMHMADPVTVTAPGTTSNINFSLEVAGSISGVVTDESGNPIGNCHVNASIYETNEWVAGINTNTEGYYTLVVPAGGYKVGAHPSLTGLNYITEFYNDKSVDNADNVSVTSPGNTDNISFKLARSDTAGFAVLPLYFANNTMMYLGMNVMTPYSPFNDPRVRLATYLALDRDSIASAFGGNKVVSIVEPDVSNPNVDKLYDPNKAKQILAEAGYPNGFLTEFYLTNESLPLADNVSWYLANIGIAARIQLLGGEEFAEQLESRSLGFFLTGTEFGGDTPWSTLGNLLSINGDENYTDYYNTRFDQFFDNGEWTNAEKVAFSLGIDLSLNLVSVGFNSNYGYNTNADSLLHDPDNPVMSNINWGTNLNNSPDGTYAPVIAPVAELTESQAFDYQGSWPDGTYLPGPPQQWSFSDVNQGNSAGVNVGINTQVLTTPGLSVTRSFDPLNGLDYPGGTQIVTIAVTPEESCDQLTINVNTGGLLVPAVITYPTNDPENGIWLSDDGRNLTIQIQNPEQGQVYTFDVQMNITLPDSIISALCKPQVSVNAYRNIESGSILGDNVTQTTEFGTWTWRAIPGETADYQWMWNEGVSRNVVLQPSLEAVWRPGGYSDYGLLAVQWQFVFPGGIPNRMAYGSSPAITDLGSDVNEYGGEPNADLEIVTGSDECGGGPGPGPGYWRAFDSDGNMEWITSTLSDQARSSPVIADLNGDGYLEIGGGTTSGNTVEVMDRFGQWFWTFPTPPQSGSMEWPSSPAVADLDPNIDGFELVILHKNSGKVFCFDGNNSDNVDEGITFTEWQGRSSDIGIEGEDWDVLWTLNIGGAGDNDQTSTPAIGDVDADGELEVVIGSADKNIYIINGQTGSIEAQFATGNRVPASAALANLDGDAYLEIVIGSTDGTIYCLQWDGTELSTQWTFATGGAVYSSAAIGDVDNDGSLEIVIGSNDRKVYCLSATGVEEWSKQTQGAVYSSPALADRGNVDDYDIDWPMFRHDAMRTGVYSSTGSLDVYVASEDGYLYLLAGNSGQMIDRFLANGPIHGSPSIADVDGDNRLEVFFYDWKGEQYNPERQDTFWALDIASGGEALINQVNATFQTCYIYNAPGDSFIDTEVTGSKRWQVPGQNIADETGLPVIDARLSLESSLEFASLWPEPAVMGPPLYEWQYGDVLEKGRIGAGVGFAPAPQVTFIPGFDVSRSADKTVFTETGLQKLTVTVTPQIDMSGTLFINAFAKADKNVIPSIVSPAPGTPDVEFWDNGQRVQIRIANPQKGVNYTWEFIFEVTPLKPKVEFMAGANAFWLEPVVPYTTTAGSSFSRTTDIGTWTASAEGTYKWGWQEQLMRHVEFEGFSMVPTGTISGRVYKADGVTPIGNLQVNVSDTTTYQFIAGTRTREDGSYTINVPAGNFVVQARPSDTGLPYVNEYYAGVYQREQATPVSVMEGATTEGIDFSLDSAGFISGHVYQANGVTPIGNLNVNAFNAATYQFIASSRTKLDGSYTINVPAGSFMLQAKPTDTGLPYVNEYYAGVYQREQATLVLVTEGATTEGIDFSLDSVGFISGYVYKADGVTPIDNLQVNASDATTYGFVAGIRTKSDGSYTINVPAGSFVVQAKPTDTGLPYIDEYYNNVYQRAQATPVSVTAGATTPSINFSLDPAGFISGKVVDAQTGTALANVQINVQDATTSVGMPGTRTKSDGSYTLNLPAGSYVVQARPSDTGLAYANEWYQDAYARLDAKSVSVTLGATVANINFNLEAGYTISGKVVDLSNNPISGVMIVAHFYNRLAMVGSATSGSDGSYRIPGLPQGDHRIWARATGYIWQFYDGKDFYAQADKVTVMDNITGIDFTLTPGGGSMSGHVYEADGITPIIRARIEMYVSEGTNWILAYNGLSLADGSYSIPSSLKPGDYKVKAYAAGYVPEWYQESPTEASAKLVKIEALTNTPDINFTLAPLTAEAGGPYLGRVGEAITLVGTVYDDPALPVTYKWDFGDNTTGEGKSVTHTYIATGLYTATLTVTDSMGFEASDTATVTVSRIETTLTITSLITLPSGSVTVTAALEYNAGLPVVGRVLTFAAGNVSSSGTTDASGVSAATLVLPPGQYVLSASFVGDDYYLPSSATTIVTVPVSIYQYAIIALNGNLTMMLNAKTVSDPSSPAEGDVYAKGNINLSGNAIVNGDATATGTISMLNNARVTGTRTANLNPPLIFTSVDTEAYLAQANAGQPDLNGLKTQAQNPTKKYTGSYTAANGVILGHNGGKYSWITGDLTISGNSIVQLNGVLWVGGKITVSGNAVFKGTGAIVSESINAKAIYVTSNAQLKANGGDMQVIATAGGIKADGNGGVVAKIYAPNGDINFSGNNNVIVLGPMHSTKSLTITANTQVALGGTVWFDSTITMTGNSGLQGPGVIVAIGNIKITGNATSKPTVEPPLVISTTGSIELALNSWMGAVAYAPNGGIKLSGNGKVYGSVIGKSVTFTDNAQVVYPVALRQW